MASSQFKVADGARRRRTFVHVTGRLLGVNVLVEIYDAQLHQALGPARRILFVAVRRLPLLGDSIGLADEKYRSASQTNGHLKSSGFKISCMRPRSYAKGTRLRTHTRPHALDRHAEEHTHRASEEGQHKVGTNMRETLSQIWRARGRRNPFGLSRVISFPSRLLSRFFIPIAR